MSISIPTGDKVVLISGGARGMGAAHARTLVEAGSRVAIGDVRVDDGTALASELGERCLFVPLDVTSSESWEAAVAATTGRFGGLDGLVNNAGILVTESLERSTRDHRDRVIAVNQTGVYLGMQAALPALRARDGGSIVNISSTAGLVGFADTFAYVAAKFAVRGMTKAAAIELAEFGIRVNSIHPGDIETDMIAGAADTGAVPAISEIPLGRYGRPREISDLVAFLISDFSSYITGAELTADGGYTAR